MKRIYIFIFAIISIIGLSAQNTYFLYPTPPGNIDNFYQRCNYMTEHFWDNCNMKSAFSSHSKLKEAFKDYVSIASHAGADTTMASIDALIKSVEKMPKNLLVLAKIAESCLYSDSAEVYSEQMFQPFAQAVADCKKIPNDERSYFTHLAKILSSSQVGTVLPEIKFRRPDGSKGVLGEASDGRRLILFINDPDDSDSHRTLVRLSADYNLRKLHEKNYLQFVCLYPGEPDEKWRNSVKDLPESWIIGASPDVADMFNLKKLPVTVYLTPEHKILTKDIAYERLIEMLRMLNINVK